MTEKERKIQEL